MSFYNFSANNPNNNSFSLGFNGFGNNYSNLYNPVLPSNISSNFNSYVPLGGTTSSGYFGNYGNNVLNTNVFGGGSVGSNYVTQTPSYTSSYTPNLPGFGGGLPTFNNIPTFSSGIVTPTLPSITPILSGGTIGNMGFINNIPQPAGVIPTSLTSNPTVTGQDGSPLLKLVVDKLCLNSNYISHVDYADHVDIDPDPNLGIGIQFIHQDDHKKNYIKMHKITEFTKPVLFEDKVTFEDDLTVKSTTINGIQNLPLITQNASGALLFHSPVFFSNPIYTSKVLTTGLQITQNSNASGFTLDEVDQITSGENQSNDTNTYNVAGVEITVEDGGWSFG